MPKLTEFGKKLSLSLAHVGDLLTQAAAELYPACPPWSKWTQAQWDAIFARADELWAEERDS